MRTAPRPPTARLPAIVAAGALACVLVSCGGEPPRGPPEPPGPVLLWESVEDGRLTVSSTPIDGEPVRFLLDRSDVVLRGTVGHPTGELVTLHVDEFYVGSEADLLLAEGLHDDPEPRRGIGAARFETGDEVVLFLRQNGADGRLQTVRGPLGKQGIPICGWLPPALLAVIARGDVPTGAQVAALVADQGPSVLSRLQPVVDVRDVVDQAELAAWARTALDRLVGDPTASRPTVARDLLGALLLLEPGDVLPMDALKSARPSLRRATAGRVAPDRFPVVRRLRARDPSWAHATLAADLDAALAELAFDQPQRLPADLAAGLRLMATIDAEDAVRRTREVVAKAIQRQAGLTALEIALDIDPAWAGEEIVRRARMETWSRRERVIAHYATLLLRIDRSEARMLLKMALPFIATERRAQAPFLAALRREDAAPARRGATTEHSPGGLAADFVREAERYDNAMRDDVPQYLQQTFLLRCHTACGGSMETFGGWLSKVLFTPPGGADAERDRADLLRAAYEASERAGGGGDELPFQRWHEPTREQTEEALRLAIIFFDDP